MASEVKTNNISPATGTSVTFSGLNVGSDARGDILYHDGTDYTRLAKPGTPADELLTFATGASDPAWVAAAGGGKIGQVLQAPKTDTFTTSATVYTDITDLSISITPTATSSKILVMMSLNGNGAVAASPSAVRIMRDSTPIAVGAADGDRLQGTSVLFNTDYYSSNAAVAIWLDEPNTTSAVVYKIQGFCTYGTNTFYINRSNNDDDNVARVRSVSTITVMEVLA